MRRGEERVQTTEKLEPSSGVDLPGLTLQLLGVVELLDAGPGEVPAPDPVLLPVLVEAVLGAVASLPAPGAPVGPHGVAGTALADLQTEETLKKFEFKDLGFVLTKFEPM